MMWAKQSTAATVIIGPVLDSTGAEYASAVIGDLSISKNGGTLTALASAATLTLIANGQYTLVLTTGNVDTLGRAQITCNKSTYQMPSIELMVLPSTVFDALVTNAVNATGGLVGATAAITTMAGVIATSTNITAITGNITGNLSGSVGSVTGAVGSVTGAVGSVTAAVTVGTINANVVNASALAADAVAEIQSGLATAANLLIVSDGVGFMTAVLVGTISNAGTANESYASTFNTAVYTAAFTGLDSSGNRTGVTRTKV